MPHSNPKAQSNALTAQTRTLRQHSRQLIRALGLLDDQCLSQEITPAQAHALIELSESPTNCVTLAERLGINKSNASRTLKQLHRQNLIQFTAAEKDQRSHLAQLTPIGQEKLAYLHQMYDQFAQGALAQLTPRESASLIDALANYRRAIDSAYKQKAFEIRPICADDNAALCEVIRSVSAEHGLHGEGYAVADQNLSNLSEHYSQPKHAYWVVIDTGTQKLMGGAGVQSLLGDPSLGELSKMYLLPAARGRGLARRLACEAIRFAQNMGYSGLYLETTDSLVAALKLYHALGFQRLSKHRGNTGHQAGCEIAMLIDFKTEQK